MESFKKLNELLDKIEEQENREELMMSDKLKLEIEKTYTYNALGICRNKLSNRDVKEFKDGMAKTKMYFAKMKDINF